MITFFSFIPLVERNPHWIQTNVLSFHFAFFYLHSPLYNTVDDPPPNDAALADEARNVSAAGEQADQASNLPNTSVEDPIEKAEQVEEEFPCQICDFVSNWQNRLKVHMSRKHENIEQVDGNTDSDDFGDKEYLETDRYWKTGILGTIFQTFLDASLIVERSDLSKDNKAVEKAKILEARKHAFGQHFRNYPPWK